MKRPVNTRKGALTNARARKVGGVARALRAGGINSIEERRYLIRTSGLNAARKFGEKRAEVYRVVLKGINLPKTQEGNSRLTRYVSGEEVPKDPQTRFQFEVANLARDRNPEEINQIVEDMVNLLNNRLADSSVREYSPEKELDDLYVAGTAFREAAQIAGLYGRILKQSNNFALARNMCRKNFAFILLKAISAAHLGITYLPPSKEIVANLKKKGMAELPMPSLIFGRNARDEALSRAIGYILAHTPEANREKAIVDVANILIKSETDKDKAKALIKYMTDYGLGKRRKRQRNQ